MTCCLYVPRSRRRRWRRVRTLLVGFHEPRYINVGISVPSASDKLHALARSVLIWLCVYYRVLHKNILLMREVYDVIQSVLQTIELVTWIISFSISVLFLETMQCLFIDKSSAIIEQASTRIEHKQARIDLYAHRIKGHFQVLISLSELLIQMFFQLSSHWNLTSVR